MPDSSRINLKDKLRDERKTRSKLVPLEGDFYEKVAEQIRELEDEKRKSQDSYSTKYAILEDELAGFEHLADAQRCGFGSLLRLAHEKDGSAAKQDQEPGLTEPTVFALQSLDTF